MVCSVCQATLSAYGLASITRAETLHHRSYTSLLRSVDEGCYICNRLWATLTVQEQRSVHDRGDGHQPTVHGANTSKHVTTETGPSQPTDEDFATRLQLVDNIFYGTGGYTIHTFLSGDPPGVERGAFLLESLSDKDFQRSKIEELAPDTKAAVTRSLATDWINDCMVNHPQCNILQKDQLWYPTRLLDCGDQDDLSTHCRLIETRQSTMRGPYMTLSHRWGPNPSDYLQLTTKTYRQLSDGIEMKAIPQLFRDAIYVVRQLRIRYLWIDSLCIIQQGGDDYADLKRELPQMSEIYSRSFCNISAAETAGANLSLFHSRQPQSISPATVSLSTRGHARSFLVSDVRLWDADVSHSLINRRAWVLQERLLSPRIIHFGARQLFWECCTKDASEIYPNGLPSVLDRRHDRIKNLAPNCLVGLDTTSDEVAAYKAWGRIVDAYTQCGLSFASDKLVALSGIAKAVRSILNDEYVAGMWRRYLEYELLWEAVSGFGPDSPKAHRISYRAPSWSWAAVDGLVRPGDLDVERSSMYIRVEHVQLKYVTGDNTGHVCGGSLRLSGVLKQLELLPRRDISSQFTYWDLVVNGTNLGVYNVYLDRPRPTDNDGNLDKLNASECLYGMLARGVKRPDGNIYILLLQVVDAEKGVFCRIGLAHNGGPGTKAKFMQVGGHVGEDKFPCERYVDGSHTINIV